jgi:NAD+ kinase
MTRVAVFGQFYHKGSEHFIEVILDTLFAQNIKVCMIRELWDLLKTHRITIAHAQRIEIIDAPDEHLDFFISVGGDGTMLKAVTYVRDMNIPVVGINTGRLGFLSTIPKEAIADQLTQLISGAYRISERTLIEVETKGLSSPTDDLNFALNEVSINRKDSTSMIRVDVWVDQEHLNTYWSDGLIVATPTGSTGYSLSCGGPIIHPESANLLITPIAPHNLNARPLIIPDDRIVRLKVSSGATHHLMSLDSRIESLPNDSEIIIKKAPFRLKMVHLPETSFIKTLRDKLYWGEDKRN